jgi:hypothetical protein
VSGPRVFGGFIENTFVADLVAARPDLIERFPYLLITSLDSSPPSELPNVVQALEEHADSYRMLGTGVLLSGGATMRVVRNYELFTHFDEVWLFREEPHVPKPKTVDIVGIVPPYDASKEGGTGLAGWMHSTGCVAGFGDGFGLAYVTTDRAFVRVLRMLRTLPPTA